MCAVQTVCHEQGIFCPELAIEVAVHSEIDQGRSAIGQYTGGADCYMDIVLPVPSAITDSRGLAIEVHGVDHSGKRAQARDLKRVTAGSYHFDVLEVGAAEGDVKWQQAIRWAFHQTGREL